MHFVGFFFCEFYYDARIHEHQTSIESEQEKKKKKYYASSQSFSPGFEIQKKTNETRVKAKCAIILMKNVGL